jgi:hypothetical protein
MRSSDLLAALAGALILVGLVLVGLWVGAVLGI